MKRQTFLMLTLALFGLGLLLLASMTHTQRVMLAFIGGVCTGAGLLSLSQRKG